MTSPNDQNRTDAFVRQLIQHRKRIYAFILTLVGNSSDADDIMQETAALMWQKYRDSEEIVKFASLGMSIAHFKVLEFRRKNYQKKVQFNSDLFDTVLGGAVEADENIDERFEAIKKCLAKLDQDSRMLVQMRHQKGQTIKSIAEAIKISQDVAYKRVAKIHDMLMRCCRRVLREQELL